MPELPEVETIRMGLIPALENQKISKVTINRRDLRFPIADNFEDIIEGQAVKEISRRGKYLLFWLDNDYIWMLHLGMSGRITILKPEEDYKAEKHDHAVIMLNNSYKLIYNDVRRFGGFDIFPKEELKNQPSLSKLGIEPLTDLLDSEWLYNKLSRLNTNIKSALLNQKHIVGLGNIYVCEALYRAKISPLRHCKDISKNESKSLVTHIKNVLKDAIAAGGSSLKDYVQASGEMGYFQNEWAVYNKKGEACGKCDCDISKTGGVQRIKQSGRSSFYCSSKQK